MGSQQISGMTQTVLGLVNADQLGITTTHEHLLIDFSCMFQLPANASEIFKALQPVSIENLGWTKYNPFRNRDNLLLLDENLSTSEAKKFKRAGGGTIVDATTNGIGRDPLALSRIARTTGLNIVMGAGYYVDSVHPDNMDRKTETDLANEILSELTEGVGDTGIKAGIIGELGCSWPLTDNERKVLCGAGAAQSNSGASILIHPGRNDAAPMEILNLLRQSGADLSRVVMGHLDRTVDKIEDILEIADMGCYLEYDLFGWETSNYPLSRIDMPSDAQRIDFIIQLIDHGYASKIVLAQDICFKIALTRYGGFGYAHIIENIVPRMRDKGISQNDIDAMLIENPKKLLTLS